MLLPVHSLTKTDVYIHLYFVKGELRFILKKEFKPLGFRLGKLHKSGVDQVTGPREASMATKNERIHAGCHATRREKSPGGIRGVSDSSMFSWGFFDVPLSLHLVICVSIGNLNDKEFFHDDRLKPQSIV